MPVSDTWLQERIEATQLQITAYETAAIAVGTDGTQSYKLDTGQSIIFVTKLDLTMLQNTIDSLYNRYATLCARKDGSGVSIMRQE